MNCPVCQSDLNLPETIKESMELHYDCPSCFSSLFVKGGQCEVLSTGSAADKKQTEKLSAKDTPQETETPADSIEESENSTEEESQEADPTGISPESDLQEEPASPPSEEEDLPEITEVPVLEETEKDSPKSPVASPEENTLPASTTEEPSEPFEFSEEEAPAEEPLVKPATQVEDENIPQEGEDFSDVEQFGNTPAPSGKGAFYYDVRVNNIDSPDLREQVEEVLEDQALKLTPDQVHFSKSEGRLVINKISPVQAHVIVKSLLGLSLTISWNQHLIADTQLDEPQVESESQELKET